MSKNFTMVLGTTKTDGYRLGFNPNVFKKQNYLLPYDGSKSYNDSMLIDNSELEIKIGEYLPPIKNNVFNAIYLDTHYRPVHLSLIHI